MSFTVEQKFYLFIQKPFINYKIYYNQRGKLIPQTISTIQPLELDSRFIIDEYRILFSNSTVIYKPPDITNHYPDLRFSPLQSCNASNKLVSALDCCKIAFGNLFLHHEQNLTFLSSSCFPFTL